MSPVRSSAPLTEALFPSYEKDSDDIETSPNQQAQKQYRCEIDVFGTINDRFIESMRFVTEGKHQYGILWKIG